MAPGPNSYRMRVPLLDARERRLHQERWPRWIGWSLGLAISVALWLVIIWGVLSLAGF